MAEVNITIQAGSQQTSVTVETNPSVNVQVQATTGPAGPGADTANGTYTPTVEILQGVGSVIQQVNNYIRIGDMVFVTGSMVLVTVGSGEKYVQFNLPIASNLQSSNQLSGSISSSVQNTGVYITGEASANKAFINYISNSQAEAALSYSFSYPIIE